MKLLFLLVNAFLWIKVTAENVRFESPGSLRPASICIVGFQTPFYDSLNYRLYPVESGFLLRNRKTGVVYKIPTALLTPPENSKIEAVDVPDLILFDSLVTAFPLGENFVGVQLSSYKISDGSMALAQGLDVFLVLDTAAKQVLPNVLNLGITKQRSQSMGFVQATYSHFLVSHFRAEKFASLGVYREKIYLVSSNEETNFDGPFYEQSPILWYVFDGSTWHYEHKLDKRLPMGGGGELPILGLKITPVEYARRIYLGRRN